MSDQKLRDLERRWEETGSQDDEVAYLRESVRTGQLSATAVWSLALQGHAASLALLGLTRMSRRDTWEALAAWSKAFGHDQSECACGNQLCWAYLNGRYAPAALVRTLEVPCVEAWITGPERSGGILLVEGGLAFSMAALSPPAGGERLGVDLYLADRQFSRSLVIPHEHDCGPYALRVPRGDEFTRQLRMQSDLEPDA